MSNEVSKSIIIMYMVDDDNMICTWHKLTFPPSQQLQTPSWWHREVCHCYIPHIINY